MEGRPDLSAKVENVAQRTGVQHLSNDLVEQTIEEEP
jgi:hypothetical protein